MSARFLLTITHVCAQPQGSHVQESLQGSTRRFYFDSKGEALKAYNIAKVAHGTEPNEEEYFGQRVQSTSYVDSRQSITIRLSRLPF